MPRYFHFDVTLVLSRRVWRSFLIHKQASFHELHLAIQDAFGWQNYHLFQFQHPADSRRVIAGIPDDEFGEYIADAKRVKLVDKTFSSSVPVWFEYEYDFGDGWRHEVKLRGDVSLPDKFKRRLLDGERAAPPEDAGGESGYDRLLTVFEKNVDAYDDDLENVKSWMGDWNPDRFDLAEAKARFDLGVKTRPKLN